MIPLKNAQITYPYGVKDSKYSKGYHTGIDMASADYTVYAAIPGTIIEARYAAGKGADPTGWGNYVIVRTADGKYDLIHAHLSAVKVSKGQKVQEGAVLGVMGSTGQSTGPHLHFEARRPPWGNRNDVDPAAWLGIKNTVGMAVSIQEVENMADKEDKDIYLSVRVRTSKADTLIKQIIELGYACAKLPLA